MTAFTRLLACFLIISSLSACAPPRTPTVNPPLVVKAEGTQLPTLTATAVPTLTDTPLPPSPTALPAATAVVKTVRLCSPLQDVPLDQIRGMVTNPYNPPPPGSDEPHAGIDIAMRLPGLQVAVAGHPVNASLAGRVAMVTHDRFPFGNAVLIETPLEDAPDWWATANIPTPAPTFTGHTNLTCPPGISLPSGDAQQRSLYVLYGHLKDPASLSVGDSISCGQQVGLVGDSGNALNPHLHYETRVGPADISLASMAHYDASATLEEMAGYCLWSVSGVFQLLDPLTVLELTP